MQVGSKKYFPITIMTIAEQTLKLLLLKWNEPHVRKHFTFKRHAKNPEQNLN